MELMQLMWYMFHNDRYSDWFIMRSKDRVYGKWKYKVLNLKTKQ